MVTTRNTHPPKTEWSVVIMVEAENKDVPTREIILKELNTAHQELKHKAIHGRTRSPENDRIKVQWFKTWIYCLNSMATVLKEKDLDELTENLEDVKRVLSSTPEGETYEFWTPEINEESY